MARLSFRKYEGLGNDFLLIDAESEALVTPDQAVALCDRRLGVGADGVLLLLPSHDRANARRMKVSNADGSTPEMCGNGIRCVALDLARARGDERTELRIETDAGIHACAVDVPLGRVTVDMGPARVLGDRTLELAQGHFVLTVASVGNPHAVLFGEYAREDVERLGPAVEVHPAFPRRTNVEFARFDGGVVDLVVWERGVGVTLACGTGACATAAVLCAKGRAAHDRPIEVRLPGGILSVTIESTTEHAILSGPARHVFDGVVVT